MKSLLDILRDAEKQKIAIGHFNFSNFEQLKAILNVVQKLGAPVVLGLSEGERDFIGVDFAVAMIRYFREKKKIPIFLNADHTYSLEKVREAAEAGFDSVIFDGAKLSFEENVQKTGEAVKIAKRVQKNILVEGELGYIGQSSQVLREIPAGVIFKPENMTSAEEAAGFVKQTKIDCFAPAVGNIHGVIVAPDFNEKLNISRIEEIKRSVKVPLVLHGGSGLIDDDFRDGIKAGISLIHISTELRVAWRDDLEKALRENPDEMAPYKILNRAVLGIEEVAEKKLKLFNGL